MNLPPPQFRAHLRFHFRDHDAGRRRWFLFGEDGYRRVPMKMDDMDDLYTVHMLHDGERKFGEGEEAEIDCISIYPDRISSLVFPGATFELWDSGFFASGTVIRRYEGGWPVINGESGSRGA